MRSAQAEDDCRTIARAAEQAGTLARELLDFARPAGPRGNGVEVEPLVPDVVGLLSRTLGEARIVVQAGPAGLRVAMERSQLERALTNLVVNARDALAGRPGRVVVAAGRAELDPDRATELGVPGPGTYARLEVRDDGEGMDAETLARCLDPFFTTEPKGKGTGLGLATAHSQAQAAGGAFEVESRLGIGTTVTLLLPLATTPDAPPTPASAPSPAGAQAGSQPAGPTVLLVEDEDSLRRLTSRILAKGGFTVLAAEDIEDALRLAAETPPDLLLTDVVMPGLSGQELAQRLRAERPALRVLYLSGYTDAVLARYGVGADDGPDDAGRPGDRLVSKPFDARGLLEAVRGALALEPAGT